MKYAVWSALCLSWMLVLWQGGCSPTYNNETVAESTVLPDADNKDTATTDNPPIENSLPENPPVDNPPADNPPADNPPADNPPADNPPADNPPADNPPVDQPTPKDEDYDRKSGTTASALDQTWFAVANRDVGSVTVFTLGPSLDLKTATKFEVKLGGKSSEVSSISTGHDGTYILATLQYDQKVCKITIAGGETQTPKCEATGSEPHGVVTNEDGSRIYVSNMVDATIGIYDANLTKTATLDFTDANGESSVQPFALLYVRKKGQKGNLYVTDFFADKVAGKQEGTDESRQGVVYKIPGDATDLSGQAKIILPPLADTGFRIPDTDTALCPQNTGAGCTQDKIPSGAFPNQLASLTFHEGRIFVTSTCASPRGEVRFNMNVHSCVHVIDAATDKEVPSLRLNIQNLVKGQPDPRLFCNVPTDMACVKSTAFCYVTCASSDLVMRLDYKDFSDQGKVVAGVAGTNNLVTGKFPTGLNIFVSTDKTLALTYNENSRNVTVINLRDQKPEGDVQAAALPTDSKEVEILKGKDFFFTGRGRWSSERWSSCVSCHWRGLSDNVSWHFAAGPRQSTSLDGSFNKENVTPDSYKNKHGFESVVQALKNNKDFPQRIFNWTAVFDEIADFEGNTRGVSGGLGAIVDKDNKRVDPAAPPVGTNSNGNLGSAFELVQELVKQGGIDDWIAITEYVKTIRSPRAKTNLKGDPAKGKALFDSNYKCSTCHAGGAWTLSQRYFIPKLDGTVSTALKKKFADEFLTGKTVPPRLQPLLSLVDTQACTTDDDCKIGGNAVTGACNTTAKKCRTLALSAEFAFTATPRAPDQHACVLRNVGTFESTTSARGALEVRKNMTATAQGAGGFNIPSLLNLQLGAPYLHNGQHETLYDFLKTDDKHRILINQVAQMSDQDAKDLIAYLLSIDGATPAIPIDPNHQACPTNFP